MARGLINAGYKANKRWAGWRTSQPQASKVKTVRRKNPQNPPKGPIRPAQRKHIATYGELHGFYDIPDLTDWSAAQAQHFIEQMHRMVGRDEYTG